MRSERSYQPLTPRFHPLIHKLQFLYKKIYNYSELNIEGLFEVAMKIQEDNFDNQLRLWHEV